MQISIDEADDDNALAALGREAIRLLDSKEFDSIAARFGHALAFERVQAVAIHEHLAAVLGAKGQ